MERVRKATDLLSQPPGRRASRAPLLPPLSWENAKSSEKVSREGRAHRDLPQGKRELALGGDSPAGEPQRRDCCSVGERAPRTVVEEEGGVNVQCNATHFAPLGILSQRTEVHKPRIQTARINPAARLPEA